MPVRPVPRMLLLRVDMVLLVVALDLPDELGIAGLVVLLLSWGSVARVPAPVAL